MNLLESAAIFIFCFTPTVVYFFFFFLYLPAYAYMLNKKERHLYDSLGGTRMFWPASGSDVIYFFVKKKYLSSTDKSVILHGQVLTWGLGYTGMLAFSSFILAIIYLAAKSFFSAP